jgi:hypothetical protein
MSVSYCNKGQQDLGGVVFIITSIDLFVLLMRVIIIVREGVLSEEPSGILRSLAGCEDQVLQLGV